MKNYRSGQPRFYLYSQKGSHNTVRKVKGFHKPHKDLSQPRTLRYGSAATMLRKQLCQGYEKVRYAAVHFWQHEKLCACLVKSTSKVMQNFQSPRQKPRGVREALKPAFTLKVGTLSFHFQVHKGDREEGSGTAQEKGQTGDPSP